jgi:hypothetical protein
MNRTALCVALIALLFLLAQSRPVSGYALEDHHWPVGTSASPTTIVMNLQLSSATYALPSGGLSDGATSWNQVAYDALGDWNPFLLGARFAYNTSTAFTPANGDHINSILFDSSAFGQSFGADAIAVTARFYSPTTNTTTEADIVVNTAYVWDSYRGPLHINGNVVTNDIRRVFDHELGHVLGLDHPDLATPPQDVTAIMNSTISDLDHIELDDIEGVWSIYGQTTILIPVNVLASPPAGGTATGGGNLQLGSTAQLTATPAPGYLFTQWEDGSTNPTRTVTVGLQGGTYTATFVATLDSWQALNQYTAGTISRIIFARNQFYAFGTSGTLTSPDGVTWTMTPSGHPLSGASGNVVYGNGRFVSTDYSGNVYSSADGISWNTAANLGASATGIIFGNGMFVALGNTEGYNQPTPVFLSTNASQWTTYQTGLTNYEFTGGTYANGTFVGIGSDGNNFSTITSMDGQNWTATLLTAGYGPSEMTYGNGYFVTSCGYGTNFKSRDGLYWIQGTPTGSGNYYDGVSDMTYGDGVFLSLASVPFSSTDGGSWTQRVFNAGLLQGQVAFGADRFVIETGGSLYDTTVLPPAGGQPVLPTFTSGSTTSGPVNSAFHYQVTAANTPLAFNAAGLPAGLTIDGANGVIAGTPTVAGVFAVTLFATNDAGTASAPLTLTITPPAAAQTYAAWVTAHDVTGLDTDTPRKDGVPNLMKYLYDIDPTRPMTAADRSALPMLSENSAGTMLTVKFRENQSLENTGVNVETSTDLRSWVSTGVTPTPTGDTDPNTHDPIVEAQVPVTSTTPAEYVRLTVTPH